MSVCPAGARAPSSHAQGQQRLSVKGQSCHLQVRVLGFVPILRVPAAGAAAEPALPGEHACARILPGDGTAKGVLFPQVPLRWAPCVPVLHCWGGWCWFSCAFAVSIYLPSPVPLLTLQRGLLQGFLLRGLEQIPALLPVAWRSTAGTATSPQRAVRVMSCPGAFPAG